MDINEYKPSVISVFFDKLFSLIGVVVLSFIALFIVNMFLSAKTTIIVVGVVAALLAILVLMPPGFKITISYDGKLSYYSKRKLKNEFDLKKSYISRKVVTRGSSLSTQDLIIVNEHNDRESIDCLLLGRNKFNDMYNEATKYTLNKDESIDLN